MHLVGSRTVHRMLQTVLLRPARGLARSMGLGRIGRALRRTPPRPKPAGPGATPGPPGLAAEEWLWLQRACSERERGFFSDNVVSNESSYLQAAAELAGLPAGQIYLGVGPEQTLSYLALLEPDLAFVVDLRRDNARLHWLYKGLFLAAKTRGEWLALLLGRPARALDASSDDAPLADLLDSVERLSPSQQSFGEAQAVVRRALARASCPLPQREARRLCTLHRRLARRGLALRFELRGPSRHDYPTLRSLLLARSPDGAVGSFLATDAAFQRVRRMEQQHRVVPLVGNLAGAHALTSLADELRRRRLTVGVLYLSNVEQYLFEQRTWQWWLENLAALPLASNALVLRSYLDQGERHPWQMAGHRVTTVAQRAAPLLEPGRAAAYSSYFRLVTDERLSPRAH